MFPDEKKLARLTSVLKMYYEQEMSQKDIAKELGVSRPMVSKMLAEAKRLNMVTITINEVRNMQQMLSNRLKEEFKLKNVVVVKTDKYKEAELERNIAHACYDIYRTTKLEYHRVGMGCGAMIGQLTDIAKLNKDNIIGVQGEIFPLIGGIKASYRSYHTNELVRIFSEVTGLKSTYLYLPALLDSAKEKQLFKRSELYSDIEAYWKKMNIAILNVSNRYSTPDLATSIRFGDALKKKHAVGRYLAHYYDIDGNFIDPEQDNVIQIEIDCLKQSQCIIGMCSGKTDSHSALGALRTGVFTDLVISDILAEKVLNLIDDK